MQVQGDVVTVDGVNVTVTGTYDVGNAVNVSKLAYGIYVVAYPNGQTQFTMRRYELLSYFIQILAFIHLPSLARLFRTWILLYWQ